MSNITSSLLSPAFFSNSTIVNTTKSLSNAYQLAQKLGIELLKTYEFVLTKANNNNFTAQLSLPNGVQILGVNLLGFVGTNTINPQVSLSGLLIPVGPGAFQISYSEMTTGGIYFSENLTTYYMGTENFEDGDHCTFQIVVLLN
jgi:hypothetical protein